MKTFQAIALLVGLALPPLFAGEPRSVTHPLFQAIRAGDGAKVEVQLKNSTEVDTRDEYGNTPLMAAAWMADTAVMERLLRAGVDVNASNKGGATALLYAATFEEKAKLLVAAGANVRVQSKLGNTSLDPLQQPPPAPLLLKSAAIATTASDPTIPVDFARDIQPVPERSCVSCHGGERPKGGFQMTDRASLIRGGLRGEAAVIPGKAEVSPLLHFVQDQVEDLEMPPVAKRKRFPALTTDEAAKLRAWIHQGANWPEGVILLAPRK